MKKVKGCEVYFSGSFPWTSPLSDRKVPNGVMFYGTALQCWNSVVTVQTNVATILQRCVALKIVVANRLL